MTNQDAPRPDSSVVRVVVAGYSRLKGFTSRILGAFDRLTSEQNETRVVETDGSGNVRGQHPGRTGPGIAGSATRDRTPVTPKERIKGIVETEGDWVRQSDIVDAVDLSSSTVSRHLCWLEDEGTVQRVTIGREKAVAPADVENEYLESDCACEC